MKIGFTCASARVVVLLLGLAAPGWAQEVCMLIPTPLAERVAAAPLIVEASVKAQQAVSEAGHIYTLSELTVYKVFRGTEPSVLRLAEAGGTVGLRREVVSTSIVLAPEQQGLFLLEPNPLLPGTYRLVAGPQGFVRYDLADRTASEPFGRYASIAGALYPAVVALAGQPWRTVWPNAALAGALPVARPTAQPVISSFSPASLTAGTGNVLTINGSNFGPDQGSRRVEFRDANSSSGFVAANSTDYVSWSDTRIQVRVPSSVIGTGGVAGTGNFRVVNDTNETGTSPSVLTVVYALSNITQSGGNTPTRPKLVKDDAQGGYTLNYSPSFTAVAGASASFEQALASWACATPLRRVVGAVAAPEATASDDVNVVRFGPLGASTLGVANSYYSGCFVGTLVEFSLVETDYTFSDAVSWHYGTGAPGSGQFDFESVALHELGHGTQLNHIIAPTAVMHFSIANGQSKRVLSAASDIAAGQDVFSFSGTNSCAGFVPPTAAPAPAGCRPLPVELTAFSARYATGAGTVLAWSTASERNSAYFAVEALEDGSKQWVEVLRQPAAGSSSRPRTYEARDPRLLSGTRYYRLRQVDHDTRTSFSGLATVSGLETGLALYPNPVAGRLQVSGSARPGRLTFYDVLGHQVARFELAAGPNDVDVSALRPGLYQVEWADGRTVRRGRLQKL